MIPHAGHLGADAAVAAADDPDADAVVGADAALQRSSRRGARCHERDRSRRVIDARKSRRDCGGMLIIRLLADVPARPRGLDSAGDLAIVQWME